MLHFPLRLISRPLAPVTHLFKDHHFTRVSRDQVGSPAVTARTHVTFFSATARVLKKKTRYLLASCLKQPLYSSFFPIALLACAVYSLIRKLPVSAPPLFRLSVLKEKLLLPLSHSHFLSSPFPSSDLQLPPTLPPPLPRPHPGPASPSPRRKRQ